MVTVVLTGGWASVAPPQATATSTTMEVAIIALIPYMHIPHHISIKHQAAKEEAPLVTSRADVQDQTRSLELSIECLR